MISAFLKREMSHPLEVCEPIKSHPFGGNFYDPLSSSRAFECLISLGIYEKNLQDSYNTNAS